MGMQVSSGGNLSTRLRQDLFLVKPSGISLFDLKGADLLVSDSQGKTIEGQGSPTKEIQAHLGIYGVRLEVGGIVHYHPPYSTSFAVCERTIPLKTVHALRILGTIPLIPHGPEGSKELADRVRKAFSDPSIKAALLAGHGIIAAGADLRQAQNMAELVEESAKIAYVSEALSR